MKRTLLILFFLLGGWSLAAQTTDSLSTPPADLPIADFDRPGRYVVRDVRVHGTNHYDPVLFRRTIGMIPGDTIMLPGPYVSDAIRTAWDRLVFSDIEITAEVDGDGVSFDVYLTERPRVRVWRFEGVRSNESKELTENLQLRIGTELSDFVLDKNEYFIKKYFADKGFLSAEVSPRVVDDTVALNTVNVVFVVDKGPKVRIGAINFIGNEEFPDARLRRTFKNTNQVGINFFKNHKFDSEEFEADQDNLLDFYNSKGYRNAMIVRDSIYRISDNRLGIDVVLDEGNQFYYRNVSWTGNTIYPTEDLDRMLGIERGAMYDRKALHKRLGIGREEDMEDPTSVKSIYQNRGYLMSNIEAAEIVVGEDSLDLQIKVFEGKPFTINNVDIVGNEKVYDNVIRRELRTLPGELYSRELVVSTVYRLSSMNHFNPEKIAPDVQVVDDSDDLVNVGWNLEEQASDKLDLSGGFGAGMFVGSVGIQLNNVSLKKFFKKGTWTPYPQGQNQQLQIRGQSNGQYYSAISLGFTEPWLGGKKPHSLTVSGFYSAESNANYWEKASGYFRTIGISGGIGFRLNWPDQYFSLYTELGYQRYMLNNWGAFLMGTGNSNVVTLRAVLSRSSVSQPIFPRYGSEFSIALTLTPPVSLMDGKDYSNPKLSDADRYNWIEYHKWKLSGRFFHPLTNNQKLVLMASAEMGYLGHYNPNKLSPFEAFRVGGDGMTGYTMYGEDIIAMRGYKDGELVPIDRQVVQGNDRVYRDNARVYNKFTLEVRYPIILEARTTIYGLVFAEAGNGFSSWRKFNPFQVKRSAGIGARVFLPVVGMLGVDWAWGFDKPAGGTKRSGSQFHLTLGTNF